MHFLLFPFAVRITYCVRRRLTVVFCMSGLLFVCVVVLFIKKGARKLQVCACFIFLPLYLKYSVIIIMAVRYFHIINVSLSYSLALFNRSASHPPWPIFCQRQACVTYYLSRKFPKVSSWPCLQCKLSTGVTQAI